MSTEHVTVVGQTNFHDKAFLTSLLVRPGLAPQVRVDTFILRADSVEMRLKSTLALRMGPAVEVARAILAAAELYRASIANEVAL